MIAHTDPERLMYIPNKKLKSKAMFKSMIVFLIIIFILITFSHGLMIIPLFPLYILTVYCMIRYIKLWKYHSYSVPRLLLISGLVVIVSLLLAPIVRAGAWIVAKALFTIPSLLR